jgi:hypothetical protein
MVQASVLEDAEGLICKVALLDGQLAEACQVREVADEKFCSLSDALVDCVRWLVVFEIERQEHFEELSLLRAWGAELCLDIVGPSHVRNHLAARMRAANLQHTEMIGELIVLEAVVSSTTGLVLGRPPNETSRVKVTNELVVKFRRWEELCSWLKGPGMRIYDLLLGPPPSQA